MLKMSFLWSCVPVGTVRAKEKRGGCVIRPTASESPARDTREKGAQKAPKETNVTSEPTARPVRPGLGGRRWWNGWTGAMNGGFCGAGLALALSLNGGGFGDLGRVDTKSTVRREKRSSAVSTPSLSFPYGRNN